MSYSTEALGRALLPWISFPSFHKVAVWEALEAQGSTQMCLAKGRRSGESGIILTIRDREEQRVLAEEQPLHS